MMIVMVRRQTESSSYAHDDNDDGDGDDDDDGDDDAVGVRQKAVVMLRFLSRSGDECRKQNSALTALHSIIIQIYKIKKYKKQKY